jgi:hypothetical protein
MIKNINVKKKIINFNRAAKFSLQNDFIVPEQAIEIGFQEKSYIYGGTEVIFLSPDFIGNLAIVTLGVLAIKNLINSSKSPLFKYLPLTTIALNAIMPIIGSRFVEAVFSALQSGKGVGLDISIWTLITAGGVGLAAGIGLGVLTGNPKIGIDGGLGSAIALASSGIKFTIH